MDKNNRIKIGSHVGMRGKEMLTGSVKEALSYGASTFMVYTGAPQNTKRKKIEDLNINQAWELMRENYIEEFVVHAPYIINLGNTVNPDTFSLATEYLALELKRTSAMGSHIMVLHPGSHVGAGEKEGLKQICKGINEIITRDTDVYLTLETMAGKGSELGKTFEELAFIYDGVYFNDKLRVCFDTCHVNDSGYNIKEDFDGVMEQFDRVIGKDQISVFHINDSKNEKGARKDRHENLGFGSLGFDSLYHIFKHPDFIHIPKILETPYIKLKENPDKSLPPYKEELSMLLSGIFDPGLVSKIQNRLP